MDKKKISVALLCISIAIIVFNIVYVFTKGEYMPFWILSIVGAAVIALIGYIQGKPEKKKFEDDEDEDF